jgi:hypothetical protein
MMLEQRIMQRRNAVLRSWPAFLKYRSPFVVGEVVDRRETKLSVDFVPWAPAVVVASDYSLKAARYRPGSGPPEGWYPGTPDVFTKAMHRNHLRVYRCGKFWLSERGACEALVYTFGSLPVVTRTPEAAMRLAEYCHPRPREGENCHPRPRGVTSSLSWVISSPDGIFLC